MTIDDYQTRANDIVDMLQTTYKNTIASQHLELKDLNNERLLTQAAIDQELSIKANLVDPNKKLSLLIKESNRLKQILLSRQAGTYIAIDDMNVDNVEHSDDHLNLMQEISRVDSEIVDARIEFDLVSKRFGSSTEGKYDEIISSSIGIQSIIVTITIINRLGSP